MVRSSLAAIGGLVACSASASAQFTFITRTDFTTAAGAAGVPLTVESFESLPRDSGTASQDSLSLADFALSAVNENFTFLPPLAVLGAVSTGGAFATDGAQHVNVGSLFSTAAQNDVVLTFTFAEGINFFGLDFTGLDNFGTNGGTDVTLTTNTGLSFSILQGSVAGPTNLFFGFSFDDPTTEITIRATAGDSFGIDAVTYGVVPSPAGAAALGLAGLTAVRRRRA